MPVQRQEIISGLDAPAYVAYSVTPNDSTDLPNGDARALYIGSSGDVEVITSGATTVVFKNVPTGFVLPVRVSRVKAANTTATFIVALA